MPGDGALDRLRRCSKHFVGGRFKLVPLAVTCTPYGRSSSFPSPLSPRTCGTHPACRSTGVPRPAPNTPTRCGTQGRAYLGFRSTRVTRRHPSPRRGRLPVTSSRPPRPSCVPMSWTSETTHCDKSLPWIRYWSITPALHDIPLGARTIPTIAPWPPRRRQIK